MVMTPPSMGSISDAITLLLPTTKLLLYTLGFGAHGEIGIMLLLHGANNLTTLMVSVSGFKLTNKETSMIPQ